MTREEQLELLKHVQSRFLRHNLRNEHNTILARLRDRYPEAEFALDRPEAMSARCPAGRQP